MSDLAGKITAALDKAQADLDAGRVWDLTLTPRGWARTLIAEAQQSQADLWPHAEAAGVLIGTMYRREARQIEHARDVLARHAADERPLWCHELDCEPGHDHDEPTGFVRDECNGCGLDNSENALPWPCEEIKSLAHVWLPDGAAECRRAHYEAKRAWKATR